MIVIRASSRRCHGLRRELLRAHPPLRGNSGEMVSLTALLPKAQQCHRFRHRQNASPQRDGNRFAGYPEVGFRIQATPKSPTVSQIAHHWLAVSFSTCSFRSSRIRPGMPRSRTAGYPHHAYRSTDHDEGDPKRAQQWQGRLKGQAIERQQTSRAEMSSPSRNPLPSPEGSGPIAHTTMEFPGFSGHRLASVNRRSDARIQRRE